jgi:hypothetical protein
MGSPRSAVATGARQRVALEQRDDAARRLTDPEGFGKVALRIS